LKCWRGQEGKGQRTEEWIGRGKMEGGERNGKGERRGKGMNTLPRGWIGYV